MDILKDLNFQVIYNYEMKRKFSIILKFSSSLGKFEETNFNKDPTGARTNTH